MTTLRDLLFGSITGSSSSTTSGTGQTTSTPTSGGTATRRLPGETSADYARRVGGGGTGARTIGAIPYQNQAAYDFLLGSSPYLTSRQAPGTNELKVFSTPDPFVKYCEMHLRDFSGGLGQQVTDIAEGEFTNRLAWSDLEHRYSRTLALLPLEEKNTTSGNLMGSEEALHVAYIRGDTDAVIVAGGSTSGQCLFRIDSDSSGNLRITALTYNPGSVITCLATVQIGGTNDEIGRAHV